MILQHIRRRFPLQRKAVRTPPARFTIVPARDSEWQTSVLRMEEDGGGYWELKPTNGRRLLQVIRLTVSATRTTPSQMLYLLREHADPKDRPNIRLDELPSERAWVITLRYKVEAQPSRKEPRRLRTPKPIHHAN